MRKVFDLVNEWRDSIFYAVLPTVALAILPNTVQAVRWGCAAVVYRELFRWAAWVAWKQPMLIGGKSIDQKSAAAAAMVCASVATIAGLFVEIVLDGIGQWYALCVIVNMTAVCLNLHYAGGITGARAYYRDHMWDWPRKCDGGGSATKSLVTSIQSLTFGTAQGASA